MKSKTISKILGWGLAAGLAFSLGAGVFVAPPVAAAEMEWGTVSTPSWTDNVIVPGSDIYHYAVAPDGDTIYAVGAINSVDVFEESIVGLSGSFYFHSGWVTITTISSDVAEIEGEFTGDACYLFGDFTVCGGAPGMDAAISGVISGSPDPGNGDDVLEFSGMLYGSGVTDYEDLELPPGEFCVNNWMLHGNVDGFTEFGGIYTEPRVWKTTDGGYTWADITGTVQGATNLPGPFIQFAYGGVAVTPDDGDFLVIAGTVCDASDFYDGMTAPWVPGAPAVAASKDGASGFSYAGDMHDNTNDTWMNSIFDIAVSPEVDDIHHIAVAGMSDEGPNGTVFRLDAGTWLTGSWEDTSFYDGWDNGRRITPTPPTNAIITLTVNEVEFSTNFDLDQSILCMGTGFDLPSGMNPLPFLQSGIWESGGTWNGEAAFPDALEISADGSELWTIAGLGSLGMAIPADYDGSDPGARSVFCYVDAFDSVSERVGGYVFRIDNDAVSLSCGPSGDPLLASIDVHGDADTGKMMVGVYMGFDNDWLTSPSDMPGPDWGPIPWNALSDCSGVAVYHTEELDFCCPQWEGACKDPSGPYMAQVKYTPDGDKAYAITTGALDLIWFEEFMSHPSGGAMDWTIENYWGGWCDESAFSVSLDDGVSFNQLGLIDTDIDFISDVQVCPDCNTVYISTINQMETIWCCPNGEQGDWYVNDVGDYAYCAGRMPEGHGGWEEVCEDVWEFWCTANETATQFDKVISQVASCDSVWRTWIDDHGNIGDAWERVNHGDWSESPSDALLLRLPCDDLEDCCTVYLGLQNTTDMFYSRDCGQCWNHPPKTKITIQDIAVETENIVHVLDAAGYVSTSTNYGRRASAKLDTEIGSGHSITACCDQGLVVVGGAAGAKVAWSDDSCESFTLTDKLPSTGPTKATGEVHVACDPTCVGTIYAAVSGVGIFRTTTDSGEWGDLEAMAYDYYGIVLGRSDGTLYASTNEITIDPLAPCDDSALASAFPRYYPAGTTTPATEVYSGVARNLTPCDTACCGAEDWDYLLCGLGTIDCDTGSGYDYYPTEWFDMEPSALRICGCTTMATNSVLWAIDAEHYAVADGSNGTLWSYEDCAAKIGPDLTSPADGATLACDPCLTCAGIPFTLKWERMCHACSYDIYIMDENENLIVEIVNETIVGDPPSLYIDDAAIRCGYTYTWKVRESDTACECVHSPWSEIRSFTIEAQHGALHLVAPVLDATNIPVTDVAFSWSAVPDADSYSFVLSPNADLSGALASEDLSSTAYKYTGTLDYEGSYFWKVIAFKGTTVLAESNIWSFTARLAPDAPPPPPVTVEQTPPPQINIPPAQMITPTWIYAIIGIGCALAVVVIVLIVRTRRPS